MKPYQCFSICAVEDRFLSHSPVKFNWWWLREIRTGSEDGNVDGDVGIDGGGVSIVDGDLCWEEQGVEGEEERRRRAVCRLDREVDGAVPDA